MSIKQKFRRIQRAFAALAVEPEEAKPIRVEEPAPARKPKPQNAGRHWRRVTLDNLSSEQSRAVEQVTRFKLDKARAEMLAFLAAPPDGWGIQRDALVKTLRAQFGDALTNAFLRDIGSSQKGFAAVEAGTFRLGRHAA